MYQGEKFNSISHLVGTALSLMGLGALISIAVEHRDPWLIASFITFGITLVLLYSMSTLYHSFQGPWLKRLFQIFDHVAIFLLIAGTYTPYMLVTLREGNGLLILGIIWGLAILGIVLEFIPGKVSRIVQFLIYLAMGWASAFDISSLQANLHNVGYWWLVAGGIAYSSGVVFYILDKAIKLRHAHGIWHLFVMAGSICHFISIIGYVR